MGGQCHSEFARRDKLLVRCDRFSVCKGVLHRFCQGAFPFFLRVCAFESNGLASSRKVSADVNYRKIISANGTTSKIGFAKAAHSPTNHFASHACNRPSPKRYYYISCADVYTNNVPVGPLSRKYIISIHRYKCRLIYSTNVFPICVHCYIDSLIYITKRRILSSLVENEVFDNAPVVQVETVVQQAHREPQPLSAKPAPPAYQRDARLTRRAQGVYERYGEPKQHPSTVTP